MGGKPLAGIRVVVTRAAGQSRPFVRMLQQAGAEVVEFPTIQTVPPESYDGLDGALKRLSSFDFVIFTSVNALDFFLDRLAFLGGSVSDLGGMKVIAVGPKTASAIEANGISPDIVPVEFKAEGVLAALEPFDISGKRFLYPRAEAAREVIPEELRKRGAEVEVVVCYRTVAPKVDPAYVRELFKDGGVTVLTFTSSSTVKNFMEVAGGSVREYLKGVAVACIGPVTAKTCEEEGLAVTVMPDDYTVDALFLALTEYYGRRKADV
jgi:uroporphyrinogen III methyltransferase/synthase